MRLDLVVRIALTLNTGTMIEGSVPAQSPAGVLSSQVRVNLGALTG